MAEAPREGNRKTVQLGASTVNGSTPLPIGAIPIANVNPLAVAIVDASGTQITSFGSGSVTVTSVVPGTGATNLGKAEDAAHASGDTGTMILGVRETAPTDLSAGATNGDYEPFQVDVNGAVWVSLATLVAGENLTTNRLNVEPIYSFLNITTNTTTTVKSGAGTFHGFTINNNGFTTAGTVTIYDNTAGSGTKIGTWTIPIQPPGTTLLATTFFPPTLELDASFSTGLTIVTATSAPAADITVLYR